MPTVPLFDVAAVPDAWHRVRAPGGYEWWYFDAEDAATDTQLVAIFLEGFVFHPGYLRQYFRYLARPTKEVPPVAGDFPCAYFVLYQGGKIAHQFMTQYRPDQFRAAIDRPSVTVGPNRFERDEEGLLRLSMSGTPWKLTARGPQTLVGQTLSAEMTFAPRGEPASGGERDAYSSRGREASVTEHTFLSRAMTGADHHWVLANPLCDVRATIRLEIPPLAVSPRNKTVIDPPLDPPVPTVTTYNFTGVGYHDHNYGTGPLGPGLRRWIWGRAIFDDRVLTFHHAVPRDAALPVETHLLEATPDGTRELSVKLVTADWSGYTATLLTCPAEMSFDDTLVLTEPRVIDSAPFYLRLQYTATHGGRSTKAFCEVAYPHRLRWPVLGRMIEMSIDKSALKAPLS